MSDASVQALFAESLAATHSVALRLAWSCSRVAPLFPARPAAIAKFAAEDEERLDAYLHRFNTLFTMIQDHLFKGIATLEQEDIQGKSNKDKSNLMEKLGAIESATGFSSMAVLRNKISHSYPDKPEKQAERLNAAWESTRDLIATLNGILAYVVAKKLLPESARFAPVELPPSP